jgi:hypothetical protein
MTKLEDILQYIETKAATNGDLVNNIKVVHPGQPVPAFKTYGLRVYFGQDDWKEIRRVKIGPIVDEHYRVNVDLVFNRALTPRTVFSDAKGISYWENTLTAMFINKTNNGLFKDSYWSASLPMEITADAVILRGILNVHLQNIYT